MMHNMMFGMEAYSLFWIAIAMLLCILIVGTYIWLLVSWLNNGRTSTMQFTPQPHDAYEGYEHGYRPQQQYEQPQVQYSQTLSSEH